MLWAALLLVCLYRGGPAAVLSSSMCYGICAIAMLTETCHAHAGLSLKQTHFSHMTPLSCVASHDAGVVLPVLGALPDSLIILTSLSSASQAEAQEAVAVGIGKCSGHAR